MKKYNFSYDEWRKEAFKNPKIKAEYDRQEPEFAVIRAILDARIKKGLTQKQLAIRMKTKQSAIARLESGRANPSIGFLQKLAKALDLNLQIQFIKTA